MKTLKLSLILAPIFVSTLAFAGPQGFDKGANVPQGFNGPSTVASIKSNAKDDQVVTVRGRLTEFLGDEKYTFVDTKGDKIKVELDTDEGFNWSQIGKDELIDLTAEVDKDMFSTELKGISASLVK